MMPEIRHPSALPDAGARQRALLDYESTLLVEAGAGSGKTALMAGRVALMLAHGIHPRDIVAITFTEAAASELLERIQGFVASLRDGSMPPELALALPTGLLANQRIAIASAAGSLDEITCTTIHGFCQQLIKPYPIEARIDPGATIVDPAAADLAYHDLMTAWLSARFGRARDGNDLGRIPPMENLGGDDDFFAELIAIESDRLVGRFSPEQTNGAGPPGLAGHGRSPASFGRNTRFCRLVCRLRHRRAGNGRMRRRPHAVPGGAR